MKHLPNQAVFSQNEVDAMVQVAPSVWWDAFIRLSIASGLRVQEILRLHYSDIDHATNSVRVTAAPIEYEREDHQHDLRRPLPVHRERVVPVDDQAMYALQRLMEACSAGSHVFVPSWKLDQLWFRLQSGESLSITHLCPQLGSGFRMVQRRAAVQHAVASGVMLAQVQWPMRPVAALRATAIKQLSGKLPPRRLAEYLGLVSIASILSFYDQTPSPQPEGVQ